MAGIPPVLPTDAEDVAWALQTADALWKRGERADAIVWLRRAAQSAGDAMDDDRAVALARAAADLADTMTAPAAPSIAAPVVESIAPAGVDELLRVSSPDIPISISEPVLAEPSIDEPVTQEIDVRAYKPVVTSSQPPEAVAPSAAEAHAGMLDPWAAPPPLPAERRRSRVSFDDDEVITSAKRVPSAVAEAVAAVEAPKIEAPKVASEPKVIAAPKVASEPKVSAAPKVASEPKVIAAPKVASEPKVITAPRAEEPIASQTPTPIPPADAKKPPPLPKKPPPLPPKPPKKLAARRPGRRDSIPPEVSDDTRPPPPPLEEEGKVYTAAPISMLAAARSKPPAAVEEKPIEPPPILPPPEPTLASATATPVAPVAEPIAKPPPAPPEAPASEAQRVDLKLDEIAGLQDLPDDEREKLSASAKIHELARDEEVGGFALALVVRGEVDVSAQIVDAAAERLAAGAVLRARGTLTESVPLRLVCASSGAVVATWPAEVIEPALEACPWVLDELRAQADRVQALVGVTLGPLADRLDAALRRQVTSRLQLRELAPGEVIIEKGEAVKQMLIIGQGRVEVGEEDLGAGDLLFPMEILGAGAAPATARAGKTGALVLQADRVVAQELMVTCPPLLEIFGGM